MSTYKDKLKHIKAMAFDVDGVFTDGNVYLVAGGEFMRSVNIKDGYAVQYCVKQEIPIAVITGGRSEEVSRRFKNLGVTDIYLNSSNKFDQYEDFRMKYGLDYKDILYMGDDVPDYEIMSKTGLPVCPSDAVEEIKQLAEYISDLRGGEGCVRDVIEQVLKAQGKWLTKDAFEW
jgi:3-deoxy-D-manno-octulosonate 8-phosphate phosphatase (KDO 8-P phosphatase)